MVLKISRALRDALLAEAVAAPGREVCGLLVGGKRLERLVPARNVAETPETRFEIDPATLFAAIRAEREGGERLLGYYHSHPSGSAIPSKHDRMQAAPDGRVWIIVAGGEIAAWRLSKHHKFERLVIELTH